jgi:hypothetical protein
MIDEKSSTDCHSTWRQNVRALFLIFALALIVRSVTAYLIGTHLEDAGWFPYSIYNTFDAQARNVLDGNSSAFWIDDASQTGAAVYPPGYPLWLAFLYALSGLRSIYVIQIVHVILDSGSVLLLVAIGTTAFGRRIGIAAGILAALSPLLAVYGATPLADAPTSWIVLGGVWMLVAAAKKDNILMAIGAGLMIGASCWFRSNALLLSVFWAAALFTCLRTPWHRKLSFALAVLLGAFVLLAPIVIRNTVAFHAFVPTGLGAGTNLWEGIGETARAEEFGAVYGDEALIARERSELGLPQDARFELYWPDGVQRDRERMRKAMNVIASHPVWYAGVMARRMWGHLKYTGSGSPSYGSTGTRLKPAECLPPSLQYFPLTAFVKAIDLVQVILRVLLLPLMLIGIALGSRENLRIALIILATVFYYLFVGTFMHSEIRYSLPMQAVLFVFAGYTASRIISGARTTSTWRQARWR